LLVELPAERLVCFDRTIARDVAAVLIDFARPRHSSVVFVEGWLLDFFSTHCIRFAVVFEPQQHCWVEVP
jgi:hypothetical protein